MGLFSRKKEHITPGRRLIPDQELARLTDIGKATFSDPPSYLDVSGFYLPGFLAAGSPTEDPAWSAFVDQFVTELSEASMRSGGWATAGAFHVAKDFVKSSDWSRPNLMELMERALVFLADEGVEGTSIPMFALTRWSELKQAGN